ncbi:MAG: hypothetical protein JXB43_06140 [Dehalococcoidia bacterium]|nr:hypothetical protein [Dehalococcoidia bacterium]
MAMEIVNGFKPKEGEYFLNIEGTKGESLFHKPVIWFFAPDFQNIKKQFIRYKEFIEQTKEERLLSIVAALSVEEALDLCLGSYIPKYQDKLGENTGFTFFLKIQLARSLYLIPDHILKGADLIRDIRNKFAHNLAIENLDSLGNEFNDRLKKIFQAFSPERDPKGLAVKDLFVEVAESVIVGLGIYASHTKAARQYIYSKDFLKQLENRMKGEGSKRWVELKSKEK